MLQTRQSVMMLVISLIGGVFILMLYEFAYVILPDARFFGAFCCGLLAMLFGFTRDGDWWLWSLILTIPLLVGISEMCDSSHPAGLWRVVFPLDVKEAAKAGSYCVGPLTHLNLSWAFSMALFPGAALAGASIGALVRRVRQKPPA